MTKKIELGVFTIPPGASHYGVLDDLALRKVWDNVGPCFGYLKSDGWRIQIHMGQGKINFFSREGIDYVKDFPILARKLLEILSEYQFIIDTEIVGFDRFGKHIRPERIREASKHVAIVLDALYIGENNITEISTEKRQKQISTFFSLYFDQTLRPAEYLRINSFHDLHVLYESFLRREREGYDGVILKGYESSYFTNAIKVKKEITIDPVIIGAFLSKPNRIKSVLIAVIDNETKQWVPIGKVTGQGPKWEVICKSCLDLISPKGLMKVMHTPEPPDIWVIPEIVVQITARSVSQGALGSYILHVDAPRDIFIREDKKLLTSTTFGQLLELGNFQKRLPMPLSLFGDESEDLVDNR